MLSSPAKKKGEKVTKPPPLGRVLLEGTWLVCRLTPSRQADDNLEAGQEADLAEAGPSSCAMGSWGKAISRRIAQQCANKALALPVDVFFVINYINFQVYRFAVLVVHCIEETMTDQGCEVLAMRVPDELQVHTSVEVFSHLDLDLQWTARWYKIVEQGPVHRDSLLDSDDMRPDAFWAEPTDAVGSWRPWKGKVLEAKDRQDRGPRRASKKRKRQGTTGTRAGGKKRKKQQTPPAQAALPGINDSHEHRGGDLSADDDESAADVDEVLSDGEAADAPVGEINDCASDSADSLDGYAPSIGSNAGASNPPPGWDPADYKA